MQNAADSFRFRLSAQVQHRTVRKCGTLAIKIAFEPLPPPDVTSIQQEHAYVVRTPAIAV
jgi:hypothetical protein